MLPYETKCLQRIFDTTGLSDTTLLGMIKGWLLDAIASTHFNEYDYTIIVGDELLNRHISLIFDDPMSRLSHILDRSRIKIEFCVDPLLYYRIKIEWQVPVYRTDGLRMSKIYFDEFATFDAHKNINRLPQIKKVIYNPPATIIFWSDNTKTVVQCQSGDIYDHEKGLAMAIAKKALGNTSRKLNDVLHKWEKWKKKEEPSVRYSCSNCKHNGQKLSKEPCKSCDPSFWSNWEANK